MEIRDLNSEQILEALNDKNNREDTKKKRRCSELAIQKHPTWLFQNYIDSGRAAKHAKKNLQHLVEMMRLTRDKGV
jgi:hypothetical protein